MFLIFRLIKLGLIIGLIYVLYKVLWKGESLFKSKKSKKHPQAAIEKMKRDPVCGTFLPANQAIKYTISGETHYFCSQECKQDFQSGTESKSSANGGV